MGQKKITFAGIVNVLVADEADHLAVVENGGSLASGGLSDGKVRASVVVTALVEDAAVLDGAVSQGQLRELPLGSSRPHDMRGRARKSAQRIILITPKKQNKNSHELRFHKN